MGFQKATRKGIKLRLALCGPTGSGKTKSALRIATGFGLPIRLIDTENRSASRYAANPGEKPNPDRFDFEVLELERFGAADYIAAIESACMGFDGVLIIDSFSHAWAGAGGFLEKVDTIAQRSQSKNSFAAWREVTPEHNRLVDVVLRCPLHVIVTMRSKMEYILEEGRNGTKIPTKVGMAPIQRDGVEYEFDVVGSMLPDSNRLTFSKTRCDALRDRDFVRPGPEVGRLLLDWVKDALPNETPALPVGDAPEGPRQGPAPSAPNDPPPPGRPEAPDVLARDFVANLPDPEKEAFVSVLTAFREHYANGAGEESLKKLSKLQKYARELVPNASKLYLALIKRATQQAKEAIDARNAATAAVEASKEKMASPPPSSPPADAAAPSPPPDVTAPPSPAKSAQPADGDRNESWGMGSDASDPETGLF